MSSPRFESQVTIRRPGSIFYGLVGVFCAWLVATIAQSFARDLLPRLETFAGMTEVFRRSQWASTVALAAWVAMLAALAFWLLGKSLRRAFGFPVWRRQSRWLKGFTILRWLAAVPILIAIGIWAHDEWFARRTEHAESWAIGLGVVLCLFFAYDVPRLVLNAVACLRARLPLLRVPDASLAELEPGGAVRLRGLVAPAPGGDDPVVFRWIDQGPDDPEDAIVEAKPFMLEDGAMRALVEVDPSRLVVQATIDESERAEILVGDTVAVVGRVAGQPDGGDAYRAELPRIVAGPDEDHRLYLFADGKPMSRRLVLAAIVELLCAAGLAACLLGLIGFWLFVGLRAFS